MIGLIATISVSHYLVVGAILFVTGAVCMATKRNGIGVLCALAVHHAGAGLLPQRLHGLG